MPTRLDYRGPDPGNQEPPVPNPVLRGLASALIHAFVGTMLGLGCSIGLWAIFGGWGPPNPLVFGGIGLVFGLVRANAVSGGPGPT
jgi:hypothetical protein